MSKIPNYFKNTLDNAWICKETEEIKIPIPNSQKISPGNIEFNQKNHIQNLGLSLTNSAFPGMKEEITRKEEEKKATNQVSYHSSKASLVKIPKIEVPKEFEEMFENDPDSVELNIEDFSYLKEEYNRKYPFKFQPFYNLDWMKNKNLLKNYELRIIHK